MADDYEVINLEIISQNNPINFSMPNYQEVSGIGLDKFEWVTTTPPCKILGIRVDGVKGCYNETGFNQDILESISYYNGAYRYQDLQQDDNTKLYGNTTDLTLSLVSRDNGSSADSFAQPIIAFSSPYLIKLTLILKKI